MTTFALWKCELSICRIWPGDPFNKSWHTTCGHLCQKRQATNVPTGCQLAFLIASFSSGVAFGSKLAIHLASFLKRAVPHFFVARIVAVYSMNPQVLSCFIHGKVASIQSSSLTTSRKIIIDHLQWSLENILSLRWWLQFTLHTHAHNSLANVAPACANIKLMWDQRELFLFSWSRIALPCQPE